MSFETERIDDCVEFMKELKIKQQKLNGSKPGELCVMATGGGAYKFYDKIREALGSDVLREDEMECLIIGMSCLTTRGVLADLLFQDSISSLPRYLVKSSHTAKQIPCTSTTLDLTSTLTF